MFILWASGNHQHLGKEEKSTQALAEAPLFVFDKIATILPFLTMLEPSMWFCFWWYCLSFTPTVTRL